MKFPAMYDRYVLVTKDRRGVSDLICSRSSWISSIGVEEKTSPLFLLVSRKSQSIYHTRTVGPDQRPVGLGIRL